MSKELTPLEAFKRIKNHCENDFIRNMLYGYEKELKIVETTLKDYENLRSHYDELTKMFNNLMTLKEKKEKVIDTFRKIVDFNVYELQGSYYLTTGNNYRGQIPIDKETYEMLKGELR